MTATTLVTTTVHGVWTNMENKEPKNLYDVEIYHGKDLLGVVTVTAESHADASNEAVKGMNVKIKRNYNG